MDTCAEEEEVSDGPLPWKIEEPAKEEVSEAQAREFERTFKAARQQLQELLREYEELRIQKEKELKLAKELLTDHKHLEKERAAFDKEANIVAGPLPPPSKTKRSKEGTAHTKLDLSEIQLATKSIQELKQKRDLLQSVFEQEKVLWKTEKRRLATTIEQFETENQHLKLIIEQTQSKLPERRIEDEVIPNPESKLVQILSPLSAKAVNAEPPSETPPSLEVNGIPFTDFALDFDYWPSSSGVDSADGGSVVFPNGEILTKFKDGRKKLKRRDCSYVFFNNGDVQIDFDDGRVAYRYKETMAIEVTLKDGITHCLFRTGQREIRFKNGDRYVVFPDRSTKYSKSNGDYRITKKDGAIEMRIAGIVSRSQPSRSR
jgi:hypothetical protein